MTAIETDLYVVRQSGKVVFVTLEPVQADIFDDHQWRDHSLPLIILPERREVSFIPAQVEMWVSTDAESEHDCPHLHYCCPLCGQPQNADLYATDVSPRFACCDRCGWDSLCWLDWSPPSDWRPYQAVIWQSDPNSVGMRAIIYAESLASAGQRLVAQFGPDVVYTLYNEHDAAMPR